MAAIMDHYEFTRASLCFQLTERGTRVHRCWDIECFLCPVAITQSRLRQSAGRLAIRVIRMNSILWARLHGGATHFPVAFIFGAALFDAIGFFLRDSSKRRSFQTTGYWLLILTGLSSFGAVFSGLVLSKWNTGGTTLLSQHHLFV